MKTALSPEKIIGHALQEDGPNVVKMKEKISFHVLSTFFVHSYMYFHTVSLPGSYDI